jgi:hypothetical protein
MIFDMQTLFSDAQAITADAPSTNVIDLGAPGTPQHAQGPISQDVGRGRPVPIRVQVVETFDNLTNLAIIMEVDNDEAFGSATEVGRVTPVLADLVAGYVTPMIYLPRGINERYVRLRYDVTGTAPTAGKVTAGLVFGNDDWAA